MKILIKTNGEEYGRLLEALARCGFHWNSGQDANNPPTLLKRDPESLRYGIQIINTKEKLLGMIPVEVYPQGEQLELFHKAKDLEHTIAFLENHFHVALSDLKQCKKSTLSKEFQEFSAKLRNLILEEYHIDIVEVMNTENENLKYIKSHTQNPDTKQVLCMNMEELYQDYLQRTSSLSDFASYIGAQYECLLTEVNSKENHLSEEIELET